VLSTAAVSLLSAGTTVTLLAVVAEAGSLLAEDATAGLLTEVVDEELFLTVVVTV
jgi:hypothetical protein